MDSQVVIEQLILRVYDLSRDDATTLAREVAEALSDRLRVAGMTGHLDLARVRIRIPDDVPRARLSATIADRIWEALP